MRTVLRLVAATGLLTCVLAGLAPPVTAEPAKRSRERAPISLVLGTVTPKTAQPSGRNSKITVTGTVQNQSGQALPGLSVRLRTSATRMSSRTQLAQYAAGSPAWLSGRPAQRLLPEAGAAGGKASFSLSADTATIGLQSFGVYPIGVEVVNQYGQVFAGINTFITFLPKQRDFTKLSVAWVWPMIDRQHRTADDTFIDDQLPVDLAPGGRLANLVDAAAATTTPVTWAVDPALLDDAQTIASGPYTVKGPRDPKAVRRPTSTVAANWINSLKAASKGDPYFALPYADPDAVALVRHRMSAHLRNAFSNSSVAGEVLGRQPSVQAAWPPAGMAGQGTLNALAEHGKLGNGSFIMSSAAFADPAQGFTPSATTRLRTDQGAKRAVAYDETLSRIVSGDTRSPGAAVLAEQRFLAETAMITAEAPDLARSVVIAPDRRWNPSPQFAKNLLTYTSSAAWMAKSPLEAVANAAPQQQREYRGYPDNMENYELGEGYLDAVAAISRNAARFTSVMAEPVTISYRRAVLRMESSYWRGGSRYKRAVPARQSLAKRLADDMNKIQIIMSANRRVSLAGNSGRIPITIANGLNQTIRVRLEVVPENTARLQVGRLDDELIELGPEQKVSRMIPVRAAGNGNVNVAVRLTTADRRPVGGAQSARTLTVRTTGYGQLALLITGGSLAVLFVGVGVRAMRARRRRKAEAAGDESTRSTGMGMAGPPEPGLPPTGAGPSDGFGPFRPPTANRPPRNGGGPGAEDGTGAGIWPDAWGGTGAGSGFTEPTVVPDPAGAADRPSGNGGPGAGTGPRAGDGPGSWGGTGAGGGVAESAVVSDSAGAAEPAGYLAAPVPPAAGDAWAEPGADTGPRPGDPETTDPLHRDTD